MDAEWLFAPLVVSPARIPPAERHWSSGVAGIMPLVGRHCALINCTGLSTPLAKDLPRPALDSAMELIRSRVYPPDHLTNEEVMGDSSRMLRKFVLSQFGWGVGGLRPSDPAALAGASRHQGRGAGSVEEAPRYATLWLQVREIQMGTLPTGRKEV